MALPEEVSHWGQSWELRDVSPEDILFPGFDPRRDGLISLVTGTSFDELPCWPVFSQSDRYLSALTWADTAVILIVWVKNCWLKMLSVILSSIASAKPTHPTTTLLNVQNLWPGCYFLAVLCHPQRCMASTSGTLCLLFTSKGGNKYISLSGFTTHSLGWWNRCDTFFNRLSVWVKSLSSNNNKRSLCLEQT